MTRLSALLVAVYLAAIVAANLILTHYGPSVIAYTAFAFIGLDLTIRDALRNQWISLGRITLWRRLAILVAAGSALSYAFNQDSARIALASAAAFGLAFLVDSIVYELAPRHTRVTASNTLGAAVDSIMFPLIAFGSVTFSIAFALFTAKVAGGAIAVALLIAIGIWRGDE